MDFRFNEEEESLRREVRRFADETLAPMAAEVDNSDDVSWDLVGLMARQGLFRVVTPASHGGAGFKAVDICIVREELSRVCVQASLLVGEMGLCAYPIATFGTRDQKDKHLPPLAKGDKLGSFSLTEPGAGSDISSIQTTATAHGNCYIVNGVKNFASVGPFAHTYTVFVKTVSGERDKGLSAFIVEKGTPGFEERQMKLLGSHPVAELIFDNCHIPGDSLLGEAGRGTKVALTTLNLFRITVGASCLGMAEGAFEQGVSYVKRRSQFGQRLAEFQNTQFQLADMATSIECARLLVYRAAWMKDQEGEKAIREGSMAKLFSSEMAWRVVDQALQLHGGYGLVRGSPIERLYRTARQPRVFEGTSEIQRITIAREILGE